MGGGGEAHPKGEQVQGKKKQRVGGGGKATTEVKL